MAQMEDDQALKAIVYQRGHLRILDQLQLPWIATYVTVKDSADGFECIKSMKVRGAPAIAIVAVLSLAVELQHKDLDISSSEIAGFISSRLDYLLESRPTAVDLGNAIMLLKAIVADVAKQPGSTAKECVDAYVLAAEKIYGDDLSTNTSIGFHGAEYLRGLQMPVPDSELSDTNSKGDSVVGDTRFSYFMATPPGVISTDDDSQRRMYKKLSVITHCNTGSLATSGHGTALGIIRSLHSSDYLKHAYCTETRPYNQGSRLTAYELVHEDIPATLVTDSMAAALLRLKKEEMNISAVIVGADRVARNGDTANKIGTYQLAVLARHHGIKFVVAAPTTSIDLHTEHGDNITVEQRAPTEMTQLSGPIVQPDGTVDAHNIVRIAYAHQGINVWNPAFDVTPHDLIDAIVTEHGVVHKEQGSFDFRKVMPEKYARIVLHESPSEEQVEVLSTVVKTDSDEDKLFRMEHV